MDIPVYQVDAFSDRIFAGNPAAICPLDAWLEGGVMQRIAAENNLSETAFFVHDGDGFGLRWFTPTVEVELCGHATLASAWVIFNLLSPDRSAPVSFETRSGTLTVERLGDGALAMDFPAKPVEPCDTPPDLSAGLGATVLECRAGPNYLARLEDEAAVRALTPDMAALARLHPRCVIATAPGADCDFVSRFFAPSYGIDEDPVTGSAHCMLTPFWADRLGRDALSARQISARGGVLDCAMLASGRVRIAGRCALFLQGRITI
jgi:PhzF family phenazine biosynthesis protein